MRRKLRGLKLNAIAAVDRPCQEGALAVIIKRDDSNDEESTMKTIEQLQAEVDKLTGQLTSATALAATEKARADTAEAAIKAGDDKMKETEEECAKLRADLAKATDETVVVGGKEFKKSVVGEASFELAKAAADERDEARFEKRADAEFEHVVGTTAEKALVLKARERMDEAAQKALDAILSSCEKMTAMAFDRMGEHGGRTPTQKQAVESFDTKVQEIAKRDNISGTEAMRKARIEHPQLFQESQGTAN
jgi:hypothetical protein